MWCGGSDFIFLGRTSLISRTQKAVPCTILTSRIVSRFNLVGNCETSTNEGEGTEPDSAGTKGCAFHRPDFVYCVQIQSGRGQEKLCLVQSPLREQCPDSIRSRIVSRFNLVQSGEGEGTEPDFAGRKSCAFHRPDFANCVQIQSGVAEKGFFDIIKVLDEKERKRAWESRLK